MHEKPVFKKIIDFKETQELIEQMRQDRGFPSGYKDWDNLSGGLVRAGVTLIAARPAMGKTSLAMNMASHAAMVEKKAVAFFSLEMSRNDLLMRLIGTAAAVDGNKIRSGNLEPEDWERIYDATEL